MVAFTNMDFLLCNETCSTASGVLSFHFDLEFQKNLKFIMNSAKYTPDEGDDI